MDPNIAESLIYVTVLMIPIVAIGGAWTCRILQARAEHEERMAMIEQGMHPDGPALAEDDPDRDPKLIERYREISPALVP